MNPHLGEDSFWFIRHRHIKRGSQSGNTFHRFNSNWLIHKILGKVHRWWKRSKNEAKRIKWLSFSETGKLCSSRKILQVGTAEYSPITSEQGCWWSTDRGTFSRSNARVMESLGQIYPRVQALSPFSHLQVVVDVANFIHADRETGWKTYLNFHERETHRPPSHRRLFRCCCCCFWC